MFNKKIIFILFTIYYLLSMLCRTAFYLNIRQKGLELAEPLVEMNQAGVTFTPESLNYDLNKNENV